MLLYIIVGIIFVEFIIERILSWLNYRKIQKSSIPFGLESQYSPEVWAKLLDYQKTNYQFAVVQETFSQAVTLFALLSGLLGIWWDTLSASLAWHPFWISCVFIASLVLANDVLSTPFAWYHQFVIEAQFGFNKMTKALFWTDKLKSYALGFVIGGVIFSVFYFTVQWLGINFWWIFWLVMLIFMLGVQFFYTKLLLPIFNKLTPLPDGSLKDAITQYAAKVQFPLTKIMVMDGSKRSTKANAFFTGFGKNKTIVLFDSLIDQHSTEELVAVLAHEVGHYKKKHIIWSMILSMGTLGIMLYFFSYVLFNKEISISLGASDWSLVLNLIGFSLLYSPISTLTSLLMHILSRKNEYEADAYAATTFHAQHLISALNKLSVDNLSHPDPHAAYVFYHYSHPPVWYRIKHLQTFLLS